MPKRNLGVAKLESKRLSIIKFKYIPPHKKQENNKVCRKVSAIVFRNSKSEGDRKILVNKVRDK